MSLHPQIAALLEAPAGDSFAHVAEDGVVLARLREDYARVTERLGGEPQPVAHVEDLAVPRADGSSIPARAYRPEGDARGAIVWAHGGGWVVGDLDGIDTVCRSLAAAAGAWVLSVDYRLAPEHPFPAAVEDVSRVVGWARGPGARGLGWDERRVVVGGDSAGGNLAAVAARHARDDDAPAPCGQLLVYPATDARRAGESYRRCAAGPMLTAADMQRCWETYLGGDDGESPDASPLRAGDLAGVAPA
ncbi:MAG TPA: alpha/beta hydrolase, partial [Solirubrobacteraceae bacterium]|nr:alpha/beta hydrolase [Solirubrobacteraceae bacterium]